MADIRTRGFCLELPPVPTPELGTCTQPVPSLTYSHTHLLTYCWLAGALYRLPRIYREAVRAVTLLTLICDTAILATNVGRLAMLQVCQWLVT